jgi:peptidoglycan/LPS O-acetylase OafA/YrhL
MNNIINKKMNLGISVIKIISTILIIFHHYQQTTGLRLKNFINFYGGRIYFGYIVELFFIISGFLTYSYITRIKEQHINFDKFYTKKYLRFYPHIIISIVVYLIINYIYKLKYGNYDFIKSINFFDFLISSIGIQSWVIFKDPGYNNPLWYVSVLMFCYIVFYFVCYISKHFNTNGNILFLFVILIGLYIVNQKISFLFLNNYLYRGYVSFFIGLFIAGLKNIKINILYLIIPIVLTIYLFCFQIGIFSII